jgi:hypothetical protein
MTKRLREDTVELCFIKELLDSHPAKDEFLELLTMIKLDITKPWEYIYTEKLNFDEISKQLQKINDKRLPLKMTKSTVRKCILRILKCIGLSLYKGELNAIDILKKLHDFAIRNQINQDLIDTIIFQAQTISYYTKMKHQ